MKEYVFVCNRYIMTVQTAVNELAARGWVLDTFAQDTQLFTAVMVRDLPEKADETA